MLIYTDRFRVISTNSGTEISTYQREMGKFRYIRRIPGWAELFDLHTNLFRQIPSNSDKLRNGNINVPKGNGEIPKIPRIPGGEEGNGELVYDKGKKLLYSKVSTC